MLLGLLGLGGLVGLVAAFDLQHEVFKLYCAPVLRDRLAVVFYCGTAYGRYATTNTDYDETFSAWGRFVYEISKEFQCKVGNFGLIRNQRIVLSNLHTHASINVKICVTSLNRHSAALS